MKLFSRTILIASCLFSLPAFAQVTPDGTTSTTVTPTATGIEINNGDVAGSNLFHSFGEFSVPTGSEAFFNNTNSISNIFSRVTGGDISNIDGILRANGTANLFLINPAGIFFGEGARLQLGGSFYGSTANSIVFPDGEFSATDLDNPPLITINAPIGLGFRDNPGDIINNSRNNGFGLSVSSGETISLIGGNVSSNNGTIFAPEAAVELGGLTETGTIQIAEDNSLIFPENVARGNVTLTNGSILSVLGANGGSIIINARNLNITSGSRLFAGIGISLGSSEAQAGDIKIDLTEDLLIDALDNGQLTLIENSNFGTGNAGNIEINARNITFQNGGNISGSTAGQGDIGSITLNASGDISFNGTNAIGISGIFNFVREGATGNVGSINIQAQNLNLINGSQITSGVAGEANSGDINLNVEEAITVDGLGLSTLGSLSGDLSSRISSIVFAPGIGNAGDINIETTNLVISNGGTIDASMRGEGNAGNLNILASDIEINGGENKLFTALLARVRSGATGQGGNITLGSEQSSVETLQAIDGTISTDTSGEGDAGNISIYANQAIELDNSDIFSEVNSDASGNAGNISILVDTLSLTNESIIGSRVFGLGDGGNIAIGSEQSPIKTLSLSNGAQVSVGTFGEGDAGDLTIFANDLEIDGGENGILTGLFASVEQQASGQGGRIFIGSENLPVNRLVLKNGSQIIANTFGEGDAGDLSIFAENIQIEKEGQFLSGLFAQVGTNAEGKGGNITIGSEQSPVETLQAIDGIISTDTSGEGDAGNISIYANQAIELDNSDIFSEVNSDASGNAGNISILVDTLSLTNESIIGSRVFGLGDGGNIAIGSEQSPIKTLSLSNGAQVSVGTFGEGDAGDLTIFANDLEIDGGENGILTGLFASVEQQASGQGGRIFIGSENLPVNRLVLKNGSQIIANTFGEGDAGDLTIFAENIQIEKEGQFLSGLFAEVGTNAEGKGGNITLGSEQSPVETLKAIDGARISTDTFGEGDAGNISIYVNEIELNNSDILSEVNSNASGNAGNISIIAEKLSLTKDSAISGRVFGLGNGGNLTIDTDKLTVKEGGQISASNSGSGDAGIVSIVADEIFLDGERETGFNSGIFSTIEPGGSGNAGGINIQANNLTINNGAEIDVSTFGEGDGGNANINIRDEIVLDGTDKLADPNGVRSDSGIFAKVEPDATGNAGDINLTSDKLTISNGGEINANSEGQGVGGNIFVRANNLNLDSGSLLSSTGFGEGGNVTLELAENLTLRNNSLISARATNDASGGNLTIDTDFIIAYPSNGDGNDILASAERGQGGEITITAEALLNIEERKAIENNDTNDIDATSGIDGLDGIVSINSPETNSFRETTEVSSEIVTQQIVSKADTCAAKDIDDASGLVVEGKGGVPPEPTEPFDDFPIITEKDLTTTENPVRANSHSPLPNENINSFDFNNIPSHIKPVMHDDEGEPIYIARGIIHKPDGGIILTAYPTPETPGYREYQQQIGCSH